MSTFVFLYVFLALAIPGIPGWSALATLFAVLLALSLAFLYCVNPGGIRIYSWVYLPLIFMFHCGLLAIFASLQGEDRTITYLSLIAGWVGGLGVAIAVSNGVRMSTVLNAMVLAALVNALAVMSGIDVFITYVADLEYMSETALLRRATGLIGNSNLLAIHAILPMFCLSAWGRGTRKTTWAVAFGCATYAVFSTGSRKALVLYSFLLIFMMIRMWGFEKWRLGTSAIVLLCGVGIVLFLGQIEDFLFNNILSFQRAASAIEGGEASYDTRIVLVQQAIDAFLGSPLWGYGLDMSRTMSSTGLYAHNNFLELLVNGGILLVLSYYAMYISFLVRLWNQRANPRIDRQGLLFVLMTLLIVDVGAVIYSHKLFPLLLLLLLATVQRPVPRSSSSLYAPVLGKP